MDSEASNGHGSEEHAQSNANDGAVGEGYWTHLLFDDNHDSIDNAPPPVGATSTDIGVPATPAGLEIDNDDHVDIADMYASSESHWPPWDTFPRPPIGGASWGPPLQESIDPQLTQVVPSLSHGGTANETSLPMAVVDLEIVRLYNAQLVEKLSSIHKSVSTLQLQSAEQGSNPPLELAEQVRDGLNIALHERDALFLQPSSRRHSELTLAFASSGQPYTLLHHDHPDACQPCGADARACAVSNDSLGISAAGVACEDESNGSKRPSGLTCRTRNYKCKWKGSSNTD